MSATPAAMTSTVNQALDAVNPLQRVQLLKQLGAATAELQAAESVLARLKATKGVVAALAALGITGATATATAEAEETAPGVSADDDGLSDDPASENYRYKDTGYIADSRKEKAANMIKVARDAGQRVRATDIDWNAIEQNPRQAKELIVKSNLFGKTDWEALADSGMSPAAGFLIDKVFASIGPAPSPPSVKGERMTDEVFARANAFDGDADMRKSYALGLETIRTRLEGLLTVDEVVSVLDEIRDELSGGNLDQEDAAKYTVLRGQRNAAMQRVAELRKGQDELYRQAQTDRGEQYEAEGVVNKRSARGWKVEPEHRNQAAAAKSRAEASWQAWSDLIAANLAEIEALEASAREAARAADRIVRESKIRNVQGNPVTRAWLTFGLRFFKLVHYRNYKGSDSFAAHVTSAKSDRIKDWSWADKDRPTNTGRKPTAQEINFQMRVAENYERRGGRDVSVASTQALKDMIGLREVQSGNWVLKDQVSAKFHVEHTAAAMNDMADILGIDAHHLGLGGRLGMAFGARGTGGKGAARAHYEPVHRVINLTKMGGGGTLGHELFHAIDNILPAIVNRNEGSKDSFGSKDPDVMPAGRLRDAFNALKQVMITGDRRLKETIQIGPKDKKMAIYNIDRGSMNTIPRGIKAAGNLTDAIIYVDSFFAGRSDKGALKNKKQWRTLAAAYYSEDGATSVTTVTGRAVSNFMAEAQILDAGADGKYWSTVEEMAARAFQSYLEDRLADQNRQNDYLSVYADNKFHVDPLLGIEWKPYPEGDERTRINAAFDDLFAALREEKVFEQALADKALLDSIFEAAE